MTDPLKICIQRAETREEWDAMQDDYIERALAAVARIEELERRLGKVKTLFAIMRSEMESACIVMKAFENDR